MVFVIEAVLYRLLLRVSIGRAALLSLVTNALSFTVGLMLFWHSGSGRDALHGTSHDGTVHP